MSRSLIRDYFAQKYGFGFAGFVAVWSRQSKTTRFFSANELESMVEYVEESANTQDVYSALSTQIERLSSQRGGATTIKQVSGLFADIDFALAKEGASSKNYPADEAESLGILGSFEIRPSRIVRTGNGLHVHFDFQEPLILNGSEEIAEVQRVSRGFQRALQAHFRAHGREIDAVGDLARNTRIPGTYNHKSSPAKFVELVAYDPDQRITPTVAQQLGSSFLRPHEDAAGGLNDGRTYPAADHNEIVSQCAWYRETVVEGAASCSEPDWHAGASIAVRCKDGEASFHAYSIKHPKYLRDEAERKLARALSESGPRTCESVAQDL